MDDENTPQSTIVPFDSGKKDRSNEQTVDVNDQQPFDFDESYSLTNDADTQDLLRAIDDGEFGAYDDQDQYDHQIPDTASEMNEDIRSMVEDMAGDHDNDTEHEETSSDNDDEDDEKDELKEDVPEDALKSKTSESTSEDLPDLEIKNESPGVDSNDQSKADKVETAAEASERSNEKPQSNEDQKAINDKIFEDEKDLKTNQAAVPNTDYGYPQPQQGMVQTSALGGLGHAFGTIINGVFGGIGMALGTGIAAIKQTKNAIGADNGTTISNTAEVGAHFHFNPAQRAMENTFNAEKVEDWKQARLENEYANLQTDMDAHLRSVDRLKQTEWAQKLTAIEESGDPEKLAKAPAILNMAKAKTDFKDADRDMNYFHGHIEQRAERLSGMLKESNQDPQRLDNMLTQWQEQAKKRLDDLPDSKDKQGILERIQNTAQNIMAGLKSLLGGTARQGM